MAVTGHDQHRHSGGGRQPGDATNGFAGEALFIEVALAGYYQVGVGHALGQAQLVCHQIEAGYELGPDGGQPAGQTSGGSGARYLPDVHTEAVRIKLRHPLEPSSSSATCAGPAPF